MVLDASFNFFHPVQFRSIHACLKKVKVCQDLEDPNKVSLLCMYGVFAAKTPEEKSHDDKNASLNLLLQPVIQLTALSAHDSIKGGILIKRYLPGVRQPSEIRQKHTILSLP